MSADPQRLSRTLPGRPEGGAYEGHCQVKLFTLTPRAVDLYPNPALAFLPAARSLAARITILVEGPFMSLEQGSHGSPNVLECS